MRKGFSAQFLASNEYYQDQGGTPEGWLTGLYRDLFNRTPDAASFFLWNQELQNGTSRQTVALGFVTSPEEDMQFVTASYQQFLGRAPDAAGASAWVSALENGMSRTDVIANLVGSAEYVQDQTSAAPAATSAAAESGSSLQFDFGPAHSPVASGYTKVAFVPYSSQQGYGWQSLPGLGVSDRNTSDPLTSDFVFGQDATFQVDLPNGTYTVTPTLGDALAAHSDLAIWAQGTQVEAGLNTAAGQFISPTFNVQVSNGQLDLRVVAAGAGNTFALDGLDIVPSPAPAGSTETAHPPPRWSPLANRP